MHCRQTALEFEIYDPLSVRNKEIYPHYDESVCTPLDCGSECILQIVRTSHLQRLKPHPQCAGSGLSLFKVSFARCGGSSREVGNPGEFRESLLEQLQPFSS